MSSRLSSIYRTHTCAELRATAAGQRVTLSGWILRKRDHGGVVFIDLRDNYGQTQVVFNGAGLREIQEARVESVGQVTGEAKRLLRALIRHQLGEVDLMSRDSVRTLSQMRAESGV